MRAKKEAQAAAVGYLAAGKSMAETARQVGVDHRTVAGWLKKPAYVAEVERMREVLASKRGPQGLIAAVEASRRRIFGDSLPGVPVTVRVRIPAGAAPQEFRRRIVRAVAHDAAAGRLPEGSPVTIRPVLDRRKLQDQPSERPTVMTVAPPSYTALSRDIPVATATDLITSGTTQLVVQCPNCRAQHRHLGLGLRRSPCGVWYLVAAPTTPVPTLTAA